MESCTCCLPWINIFGTKQQSYQNIQYDGDFDNRVAYSDSEAESDKDFARTSSYTKSSFMSDSRDLHHTGSFYEKTPLNHDVFSSVLSQIYLDGASVGGLAAWQANAVQLNSTRDPSHIEMLHEAMVTSYLSDLIYSDDIAPQSEFSVPCSKSGNIYCSCLHFESSRVVSGAFAAQWGVFDVPTKKLLIFAFSGRQLVHPTDILIDVLGNPVLTDEIAAFHVHSEAYNNIKRCLPQLRSVLESHGISHKLQQGGYRVCFTGHALGGAYAQCAFFCLGGYEKEWSVTTFGAPLVWYTHASSNNSNNSNSNGNSDNNNNQQYASLFTNIRCYVNSDDVIPRLLGNNQTQTILRCIQFDEENKSRLVNRLSSVWQSLPNYSPCGTYLHIGESVMHVRDDDVKRFLEPSVANATSWLNDHKARNYKNKLLAVVNKM